MKKIICFFLLFLPCFFNLEAGENRYLLTNSFTRADVLSSSSKGYDWISFPSYHDREAWKEIPEDVRTKTIEEGEKYLGYDYPPILATMYLEYSRTGNRSIIDNSNSKKLKVLSSLCYAELVEGKGRFIDDIINGVFSFCEQTYWGASAHMYMYDSVSPAEQTTKLPTDTTQIIDLFVGEAAHDLSWIWYLFHDEFDKISPEISNRLRRELKKRVLEPFYERNDFWWVTGWNSGNVNNWTPWCCYNVLTCILLIENDDQKRLDGIWKTMSSVDLFINSYPSDGSCNEGPSYWNAAVGKLFDYLELLMNYTDGKINIFDNEMIRRMGESICRYYISQGQYYVNFADCPIKIHQDAMKLCRYGRDIHSDMLEDFGIFLFKKNDLSHSPMSGLIGDVLNGWFNYGVPESEGKEPFVKDYYFPEYQVAIARDDEGTDKGFFFAAKGGSNGEGHGHNDVGSFILYFDGYPAFIDPGVGTYTRQTFGAGRYKIWTMQSGYHNLPIINGQMQQQGGNYRAIDTKYDKSKNYVIFSSDISKAYKSEAKISTWVRKYTLKRHDYLEIEDSYQLEEAADTSKLIFMTPLECKIIKQGTIELIGENFNLKMTFDPSKMNPMIEKVEAGGISKSLGSPVSRIILNITGNNVRQKLKVIIQQEK